MITTPKEVYVIKRSDGSYYSNGSGNTLPTIFMSFKKAKSRINNINHYGHIPTIHLWSIKEADLEQL